LPVAMRHEKGCDLNIGQRMRRRDRRTHARCAMTLRAKGADSSKTRFHRQMISVAAAITIPVTNAVKHKKSSRSLRATLMAASPCGPWSIPSAQGTPLPWRKSDLVELRTRVLGGGVVCRPGQSRFTVRERAFVMRG
jgi:hypothetical protein